MSNPTMIERVAGAVYERSKGVHDWPWDDAPLHVKAHLVADARAAIEAMREPTQAMRTAGARAMGENPITPAKSCFIAMVDAALAEEQR